MTLPPILIAPHSYNNAERNRQITVTLPSHLLPMLLPPHHPQVLKERSWDAVYGHPAMASVLPRHPASPASSSLDPNNEFHQQAILEWISLADFYQFPHVIQFDSFEECVEKIAATDLQSV